MAPIKDTIIKVRNKNLSSVEESLTIAGAVCLISVQSCLAASLVKVATDEYPLVLPLSGLNEALNADHSIQSCASANSFVHCDGNVMGRVC